MERRYQPYAVARPWRPGSNGLAEYKVIATRASEAAIRRVRRRAGDIIVHRPTPGFTVGSYFDAGRYFATETHLNRPAGARARKTAPGAESRKRRRNPPRGRAELMSTRVLALEYRHAGSSQRTPYRHAFRPGVLMLALPNGDVLLRGARGQRLSSVFLVPESE